MDKTGDETPMTKRTQQHGKDESMTETPDRHEPRTVDAVGKPSRSTPLSHDSSTTTPNSTTFEEEFKTSEDSVDEADFSRKLRIGGETRVAADKAVRPTKH